MPCAGNPLSRIENTAAPLSRQRLRPLMRGSNCFVEQGLHTSVLHQDVERRRGGSTRKSDGLTPSRSRCFWRLAEQFSCAGNSVTRQAHGEIRPKPSFSSRLRHAFHKVKDIGRSAARDGGDSIELFLIVQPFDRAGNFQKAVRLVALGLP